MNIPLFALPHRATITAFKGTGAYGKRWDDANPRHNIPCRIEPVTRRVKGSNGDDVIQQAEGIFHPDANIKQGDKVTWNNTEYKVCCVRVFLVKG